MKRILALVLGDINKEYKFLPLMEDEQDKIDKFTIKLESSEDIRKKYFKQIEEFLIENRYFIEKHRLPFRKGQIVILEKIDDVENIYIRKKVLYKKHKVVLKKVMAIRDVMIKAVKYENIGITLKGYKVLTSEHVKRLIKRPVYTKAHCNNILREIKRDKDFFDIVRLIFKSYEEERKYSKLPTIDSIYATIKAHKAASPKKNNASNYKNEGFILLPFTEESPDDIKKVPMDIITEEGIETVNINVGEEHFSDFDEPYANGFRPDGLGEEDEISETYEKTVRLFR